MFKSQGHIPGTNEMAPNQVSAQDGFFLSYNPSARDHGCATTAIVLGNHALFFILNGDHKEPLESAAERGGKQAVIDYFIANVDQAGRFSEHTDIFKANPVLRHDQHALEHLGAENIARLKAAMSEQHAPIYPKL